MFSTLMGNFFFFYFLFQNSFFIFFNNYSLLSTTTSTTTNTSNTTISIRLLLIDISLPPLDYNLISFSFQEPKEKRKKKFFLNKKFLISRFLDFLSFSLLKEKVFPLIVITTTAILTHSGCIIPRDSFVKNNNIVYQEDHSSSLFLSLAISRKNKQTNNSL